MTAAPVEDGSWPRAARACLAMPVYEWVLFLGVSIVTALLTGFRTGLPGYIAIGVQSVFVVLIMYRLIGGALRLKRLMRDVRSAEGLCCTRCGYAVGRDPAEPRCPECGEGFDPDGAVRAWKQMGPGWCRGF